MKKIIILILGLSLYTCNEPYATLTTNDEKSQIIKTLFQKVGEENIEN